MNIKLNPKGLRGTLTLNYKVEYKTNNNEIALYLMTEKMNGENNVMDCILSHKDTYQESLIEAFKEAENRWGIKLYKEELEKVA